MNKNYIGIVSDKTDEHSAIDLVAKFDRFTTKSLLGLLAAIFDVSPTYESRCRP